MRKTLLVSGLVLLALLGGAGGYYGGAKYTGSSPIHEVGTATPLPAGPPPETLPRKVALPNDLPAFKSKGLTFREQSFTVHPKDMDTVRLSIKAPRGWQLTRSAKTPGEVKFLSSADQALRVEALEPVLTPADQMAKLIAELKASQPYENDLKFISQINGQVEGDDGQQRTVATLIYTYIPTKFLRYVVVRWVATGGDGIATVEMSITGLPQDAAGLAPVTAKASETVEIND
ncbi:hypothetical protein [Kribbella sp. NPDC006257]|uniref:hypothetical protein n=1 Tax=Kribbella sp. NPDC006257 TaxID=3156738 RepID=UPI0033B2FB2A